MRASPIRLVEELHGSPTARASAGAVRPVLLREVRFEEAARISTGVAELDRVLGGGIVPGSLVLVGGEPGVGKSTLLLTALGAIAHGGRRSLLVTGEESAAQVALRWLVQQKDVITLSKTATIDRLKENFAIFDFALGDGEMADEIAEGPHVRARRPVEAVGGHEVRDAQRALARVFPVAEEVIQTGHWSWGRVLN